MCVILPVFLVPEFGIIVSKVYWIWKFSSFSAYTTCDTKHAGNKNTLLIAMCDATSTAQKVFTYTNANGKETCHTILSGLHTIKLDSRMCCVIYLEYIEHAANLNELKHCSMNICFFIHVLIHMLGCFCHL